MGRFDFEAWRQELDVSTDEEAWAELDWLIRRVSSEAEAMAELGRRLRDLPLEDPGSADRFSAALFQLAEGLQDVRRAFAKRAEA